MHRTHQSGPVLALCTALVAVFAAPAQGQILGSGSGSGNEEPPQESFSLSSPQPYGQLTRTAVGDFDGDSLADLALVRGGRIDVIGDPGGTDYWTSSEHTANDLVGLSVNPGFVGVGATGAVQYQLVGGALQLTSAESSDWLGALRIDAGVVDVGGAYQDVLVGVMSDGVTLRMLISSPTGWSSSLIGTVSGTVFDLVVLDFQGNDSLEAAVATDTHLHIYNLTSGSLLVSYPFPQYQTTSLTAGVMGSGSGWVAWTATKNSTQTEYLLAIDGGGIADVTLLGAPGIVASSTARWTGDELSDLVLSITSDAELRVLSNIGTTRPDFSMSSYTAIPHTGTAIDNVAHPATSDADLDADDDLLFPLQANQELAVHRNDNVDHATLEAVVSPLDWSDVVAIPAPGCVSGVANPYMTLSLDADSPPPAGATHVVYWVWERTDLDTYTRPDSVWNGELDLSSGFTLLVRLPNPGSTECFEAGVQTTKLYYFEVQLEKRDASGNVLRSFPPVMYGAQTHPEFTTDPQTEVAEAYEVHLTDDEDDGFGVWAFPLEVSYNEVPDPPPETGGDPVAIGSFNRMSDIPGMEPGVAIVK
jgi:hypothetical protein